MARQPGSAMATTGLSPQPAAAQGAERCALVHPQAPHVHPAHQALPTHPVPQVWALPTPLHASRDTVRAMARQAFAALLGVPALTNERGAPPRAPGRPALYLSLSHAPGLSLLACHTRPVGVDVQARPVRVDASFVALYLGVCASDGVDHAGLWTRHEARLKCAGIALTEWSEDLARQLAPLHTAEVELPGPNADRHWSAAVAWAP